jgi:hypothetical protein
MLCGTSRTVVLTATGTADDHPQPVRNPAGLAGGLKRIVAAVDAIGRACPPRPLSGQDLVHGNFNPANTLATQGRLWVVDVEALGAGPRAYDLAEALLVGSGSRSPSARSGITRPATRCRWSSKPASS